MSLEKEPNVNICPVCTGQPGSLPVANQKAVDFVLMAGLALDCKINRRSKFDRKNYFYPDLPKGYQISQYDVPFCYGGKLKIPGKEIRITRIHLEEDTGKLIHQKGTDYSLVDFNRAGVPLMELVTEPDISNALEAKEFCEKLQLILRYLGISPADMEKGHMRCEANISLKEKESRELGTKVEIKNLNSFKSVEKAIDYEISRQSAMLRKGEKIIQETRGWDESKLKTFSQREKEFAQDYRYFPEPDLPIIELSEEYINKLRGLITELPDEKRKRFVREYNLIEADAIILTSERSLAEYYENTVSEAFADSSNNKNVIAKLAANYLITEVRRYLKEGGKIESIKMKPKNFGKLISIVAAGKISSPSAKVVIEEMIKNGAEPEKIISDKNLLLVNDISQIQALVDKVLIENSEAAEDYKSGKKNAFQFLLGMVMKATGGKADPKVVSELLSKALK